MHGCAGAQALPAESVHRAEAQLHGATSHAGWLAGWLALNARSNHPRHEAAAPLLLPCRRFEGFSYVDIMLLPLAEAVAAVLGPSTRVWFALQGEMSAMVTAFPAEHQKLLPYIK
eukprot:GHRQ01018997.1.p2 GENE.GHRQ01018997.1~~GHRQ01018997.1.p2  ORF type:complete len:115 (+),score=47.42 GHRQ01018997.1:1-345(+)